MNNEFEYLIAEKIIKSLQEQPELWKIDIMGLERTDGLNLAFSSHNLYIYAPSKYKFVNSKIRKSIENVARKVLKNKRAERDSLDVKDNKKKLSKLFNLDTRKNKLEILERISEKDNDITTKNDTTETETEIIELSFWGKFLNKIGRGSL